MNKEHSAVCSVHVLLCTRDDFSKTSSAYNGILELNTRTQSDQVGYLVFMA